MRFSVATGCSVHYTFSRALSNPILKRGFMVDQIVITEKTSQAKDVRAAVGSRYGDILSIFGNRGPSSEMQLMIESAIGDPIAGQALAERMRTGEFYEWVDSLVPYR